MSNFFVILAYHLTIATVGQSFIWTIRQSDPFETEWNDGERQLYDQEAEHNIQRLHVEESSNVSGQLRKFRKIAWILQKEKNLTFKWKLTDQSNRLELYTASSL